MPLRVFRIRAWFPSTSPGRPHTPLLWAGEGSWLPGLWETGPELRHSHSQARPHRRSLSGDPQIGFNLISPELCSGRALKANLIMPLASTDAAANSSNPAKACRTSWGSTACPPLHLVPDAVRNPQGRKSLGPSPHQPHRSRWPQGTRGVGLPVSTSMSPFTPPNSARPGGTVSQEEAPQDPDHSIGKASLSASRDCLQTARSAVRPSVLGCATPGAPGPGGGPQGELHPCCPAARRPPCAVRSLL